MIAPESEALGNVLSIVPATWRDLGALQVLEKQSFPQDAWPLWDLIGILTLPNITRLKAILHGHMVGFIATEYKTKDNAAWIATIGVLPAYQQRGIGMALLEASEKHYPDTVIRLCVRLSNRPAQRMYLKAGYQTTYTWRAYYHDGEDALVMEKKTPLQTHSRETP